MRNYLFAFIAACAQAVAQPPDTLWIRSWGEVGIDEYPRGLTEVAGGYAFSATAIDAGVPHSSVYKIGYDGELLWRVDADTTYSIILNDLTKSASGKIVATGEIRGLDTVQTRQAVFVSVTPEGTPHHMFAVSSPDLWWYANSIDACDDGGFVLAGECRSQSDSNYGRLCKVDSVGNVEWSHQFGAARWNMFNTVTRVTDGYVAVGETDGDIWAVKVDDNGEFVWEYICGDFPFGNSGHAIVETASGGLLIGGTTYDLNTRYDYTILRVNSDGQPEWDRVFTWDGTQFGGSAESVVSLSELPNGDILVFGLCGVNIYGGNFGSFVGRLTATGDFLWRRLYIHGPFVSAGIVDSSGSPVVLGTNGPYLEYDAQIMKLGQVVSTTGDFDVSIPSDLSVLLYPNPFNATARVAFDLPTASPVRFEIYNSIGQRVLSQDHGMRSPGPNEVLVDATTFASGQYFFRLSAGSLVKTKSMTLVK